MMARLILNLASADLTSMKYEIKGSVNNCHGDTCSPLPHVLEHAYICKCDIANNHVSECIKVSDICLRDSTVDYPNATYTKENNRANPGNTALAEEGSSLSSRTQTKNAPHDRGQLVRTFGCVTQHFSAPPSHEPVRSDEDTSGLIDIPDTCPVKVDVLIVLTEPDRIRVERDPELAPDLQGRLLPRLASNARQDGKRALPSQIDGRDGLHGDRFVEPDVRKTTSRAGARDVIQDGILGHGLGGLVWRLLVRGVDGGAFVVLAHLLAQAVELVLLLFDGGL